MAKKGLKIKVTLIAVTSVDGKTTKGDDPNIYKWTSKEDQDFYFSERDKYNLIVMGSNTYQSSKRLFKFNGKTLRVIFTREPSKYKKDVMPDQLEFTNESPKAFLARMVKKGYKKLLLVGGAKINGLFLKEKLVDEILLTIEPIVFGRGKPLIAELKLDVSMKLLSVKKLNSLGTLLLRYSIS